MSVYYNEIDPFAAAWLRELMKAGQIPDGEVDERSIADVRADDVRGFRQCHFFAGIGGWAYALRLAGWPRDRDVWTGSCPCQRSSSAARGRNVAPELWPHFGYLIAQCRPRTVFSEQVMRGAWVDCVVPDLERMGYSVGAAVLSALCVGQDHQRERFYFVGDSDRDGESGVSVDEEVARLPRHRSDAGSMVTAHGLSRDVVALSGFGNAIVPQVAARFIEAYLDCTRS